MDVITTKSVTADITGSIAACECVCPRAHEGNGAHEDMFASLYSVRAMGLWNQGELECTRATVCCLHSIPAHIRIYTTYTHTVSTSVVSYLDCLEDSVQVLELFENADNTQNPKNAQEIEARSLVGRYINIHHLHARTRTHAHARTRTHAHTHAHIAVR
jgi:hypothetical protein